MLIIHCPACAVGLRLPRAVLAKRARRIRCAICDHGWVEEPISEQADAPAAASAPEISLLAHSGRSPLDETPAGGQSSGEAAPPPPRGARARPMGQRVWPQRAAACVALTLALASVMQRDAIVRAAPPLAGAYAAIGLPVNLKGLEWRDVKTRVVVEASQKVLAVEGEIKNLRDHSQSLPDIELSLRDEGGREVYAWKAPAPKAGLAQGETIQFRARLASPPEGAKAVRVNFADAETLTAAR